MLVLLAVNGFVQINRVKPIYEDRLTYLHEIIQKANNTGHRKMVISTDQLSNLRMVFSGSMGIETMMITSMDNNMEPLTVFATPWLEEVKKIMTRTDNFMPAPFHTSFGYDGLNDKYFRLPKQEYILWPQDFKRK